MINHSFPLAQWPLDMPLADYDVRYGEQALVASSLFREHRLHLLCGIWSTALSPRKKPGGSDLPAQLLDYLVCRGEQVLLCIHLTDREPWHGDFTPVPSLPLAECTVEQLSDGDVEEVLSCLEQILQAGGEPAWDCLMRECPEELTDALLKEHLLDQWPEGIVPSDYGMCCGLVRILWPDGQGTVCTEEDLRDLPEVLLAGQSPTVPPGDRTAFQDLLRLHRSGLSRNEEHSAQLVRDVLNQPIRDYLVDYPQQRDHILSFFPGQEATYGDAAALIESMLRSDCDDLAGDGISFMEMLAAPLLEDLSLNTAKPWRDGLSPDQLPKRYRLAQGGKSVDPIQDRICAARLPPGARLVFAPQEQFFQGVSALSKSGYPRWLSRVLRDYLQVPPRCRYGPLLSIAMDSMHTGDPCSQEAGIHLLYLLLIQPYCLVIHRWEHQKDQQNQQDQTKGGFKP